MTPAARHGAAIAILDRIAAGEPPERALTNWARASRYAGSGDRRAVRDLVYEVLRKWRSTAALGGAETGRGRILGLIRMRGEDPGAVFTGARHAPAPLTAAERMPPPALDGLPTAVRLDIPDWLETPLRQSLGGHFEDTLGRLRQRAPVFLRVNRARCDRSRAIAALAAEGIDATAHPLADTALLVTRNAPRIRHSRAYQEGLVELQDAASQAVVAELPLRPGQRVLDYCAGGGGKALAMAAQGARVTAHDAAPARMRDLPARARRAGVKIAMQESGELDEMPLFDGVLCDVPCSGSGSWRRAPWAKWSLTPAGLDSLVRLQARILRQAADRVAPGGWLAYATCALLASENHAQPAAFLAEDGRFSMRSERLFLPHEGGDGLFVAVLVRDS